MFTIFALIQICVQKKIAVGVGTSYMIIIMYIKVRFVNHWPVSRDCFAGSGDEPSMWRIFYVFRWQAFTLIGLRTQLEKDFFLMIIYNKIVWSKL